MLEGWIDKCKYGPMAAEMCMRKNGIIAIELFDVSKDGCEAEKPNNEKTNKKLKPRNRVVPSGALIRMFPEMVSQPVSIIFVKKPKMHFPPKKGFLRFNLRTLKL